MASTGPKWSLSQALTPLCWLTLLLSLHTVTGMSGWGGCLDGEDVFTVIRENSLPGEVVCELMAENTVEGIHWVLDGKDADWFFFDGQSIRLNASAEKVLDREAEGPLLMAELSCYEEDTLQSVYRIMVEVLNENDNLPVFAEDTVQSLVVSELVPVNTLMFIVQATDADNDKIIYSIDQSSPDAEYFKVDLPNSGEVILSKPLDYETKSLLSVTIHASEMSTAERFNTSTDITIQVLDGDDQYPQFQPCIVIFQDETSRVCTSPVYTVNITEGEEDFLLEFSPGPIHALDGDRGLDAPVRYAIISGDGDGRFLMDSETGEMRCTQAVKGSLASPLELQVMAYQADDPRKYSVATVLVNILAVNLFQPKFHMAEYQGFVTAGKSPASLVNTYGSKALILHVHDQDFGKGVNPMMHFTFSPTSNHTDIYQVTQEGLLIARVDRLKPKQKHVLHVMARDKESGDTTFATVVVDVLSEGQSIPLSPLSDGRSIGCTLGKALALSALFMSVLGCSAFLAMWLKRKHKGQRDPLERGCVAQGKHPNVSLRWFQLVNHRTAMPQMEDTVLNNEDYGTYNPSFSFYSHQDLPPCLGTVSQTTAPVPDAGVPQPEPACSPIAPQNNVSTPVKCVSGSPNLHPAIEDLTPCKESAPPLENTNSQTPDCIETLPAASPTSSPVALDATPTPTSALDDPIDSIATPSSQSSPSSVPLSYTRIASAEIDKPFSKPRAVTPPNLPYSPLPSSSSSPLPKQAATPLTTPEPLKARLVLIVETPPAERASIPPDEDEEEGQPSTSLDQLPDQLPDPWQPPADSGSPSQVPTDSASPQDGHRVGEEEDDGFLGDEDADKNSGDELESDEEELLRVMARCNPVFITFSK